MPTSAKRKVPNANGLSALMSGVQVNDGPRRSKRPTTVSKTANLKKRQNAKEEEKIKKQKIQQNMTALATLMGGFTLTVTPN